MYNRYQGNSGRVERVPDAPQPVREPASTAPASRRANLWFSFIWNTSVDGGFAPHIFVLLRTMVCYAV